MGLEPGNQLLDVLRRKSLRAMMSCGVLAISAIGSKSFTMS